MNKLFKYLSLSITLSLLSTSTHIHSMHVKKLAKTSAVYSLRQKSTTNKINPDDPLTQFCTPPPTQKTTKKLVRKMPKKVLLNLVEQMKETEQAQALEASINTSGLSTLQQKVKFGPLENLDFTPSTKLDFPPKPAKPWSYPGEEREISISGALYGIRELGERHKAFNEEYGDQAHINTSDSDTTQQKVKFGPLKDFVPSTELRLSGKKAEPWSGEKIEEMSVDDFLYGVKELGKRHKAFDEKYGEKVDNSKTKWFNSFTSAWKQLSLHLCKDIPIARPDDGKPSDPKYTMMPGEEIKFTKAMCQLMRDNRTPFEEQGHRANDENANISPSRCTSKALMCIPDSQQPQKKKRRLEDELKYPDGQPMGGDTLAYSVTAAEFVTMLPEFETQHRANVDRCGKE